MATDWMFAPGGRTWSIVGGWSCHLVYPLRDLEPELWEPLSDSSIKEAKRGS